MGKYVARQTPKSMPSASRIAAFTKDLAQPFLVAGSRGLTMQENKQPTFATHGNFRFATGQLADLADKHLVIFTHGYNNTPDDALRSAKELFARLHTSLRRDQVATGDCQYLLFTWPGDTGPVFFNDAQAYAHHSGVALYELLRQAASAAAPPRSISLISHSLGAHVVLRCLAILGERHYREKSTLRVDRALLLAPAVENDVFERPGSGNEYHFPEAAFGMKHLHMVVSRADSVLSGAFRVNEKDAALGYSGPESMEPLASLARRVKDVSAGTQEFKFEVHDFSPTSATILNPELHVTDHGGYWKNETQTNYYVNLVFRG
jgi:esterase/lipase superfamily enzyme